MEIYCVAKAIGTGHTMDAYRAPSFKVGGKAAILTHGEIVDGDIRYSVHSDEGVVPDKTTWQGTKEEAQSEWEKVEEYQGILGKGGGGK